MNIQTILQSNLINISELARQLWPGVKKPVVKLQNKIDQRQGQRLTETDLQAIETILTALICK